jgi:protein CpxP
VRRIFGIGVLPLVLAASLPGETAHAQNRPVVRGVVEPQQAARRQRLEQQLRQGLWRIAKQRIGLTDDQMVRLEETSRRYDGRRRALIVDERAQRLALRQEILAPEGKADQELVARSLDRLIQLQRERIELQAQEQKEFAAFMTPMQRAKYAALQEEVRRRMEALRRQRPDSARGANRP